MIRIPWLADRDDQGYHGSLRKKTGTDLGSRRESGILFWDDHGSMNAASPPHSKSAGTKLTIVIPAYNEEEAIGKTVERCLEAKEAIVATSPVDSVELVVVSDGSIDRTEEIACGYDGVSVLAFAKNRGYGAAIKSGFEYGSGELVSFLDADGTCDPLAFADFCRVQEEEKADVVLGSRMGPGSEMPRLRACGNTIFAWILGILSKRTVGDTASGMRVIRRSSLPDLYPLPDGLHFTPAMSAKVLLEGSLRMVEVPMSYSERVGRSKLSVVRDGVRFLRVIIQAAMCYRPARPLLLLAGVCFLVMVVMGFSPLLMYIQVRRLEEWMVYRILFSALSATVGALLVCAAMVAERIAAQAHGRTPAGTGVTAIVAKLFHPRSRLLFGVFLVIVAVLVSLPGMVEYLATSHVNMHWSRAVLSSLLLVMAAVLWVTSFLLSMLDLMRAQASRSVAQKPPDRVKKTV